MLTVDALIIGGGPAGATAALLLAKAGWSVAIVEKKTLPRKKVCGEFISATSLPLLQKLGIADYYLKSGGPNVKRVGLFAANTVITSAMPLAKHGLGHFGLALGREQLDSKLLNLAEQAGAIKIQPAQLEHVHRGEKFTLTISHNEIKQISTPLLIMAQGSWEKDSNLPQIPHQSSDLLAFKAHFTHSNLDIDLMPLLAFPGGYGGLAHSSNGLTTLSCCIRRDTLEVIRKRYPGLQAGEAVQQHISSTCLGVRQVLSGAKREGRWLSAGPIRPGIRKRYANGIFYVGNIAGEAHPVVAEGISMAMQSAGLMTEILLSNRNKSLDKIGKEYTRQWHKHFANRIYVAAVIAQFAMRPWLVNHLLPILKQFPSLLTLGAKLSGKVTQVVVPQAISTKSIANEMENTI